MHSKYSKTAAAAATLILLTSCATSGREIEYIDTGCKWVDFIYISKKDDLTPGTARQLWNHNEAVEKNCGPPQAR